MKESQLIVANWKKSGSKERIKPWVKTITPLAQGLLGLAHIVVCPPNPYLDRASFFTRKIGNISVGAQNFDSVDDANTKQTGQITARMLSDYAKYIILGHSEVRRWDKERKVYNGDTLETINKKVRLARESGLNTIVCISDIEGELEAFVEGNPDYDGVIAFEPITAVGTGKPMNPEDANKEAEKILLKFSRPPSKPRVIYGGSVTGEKAPGFFNQPNLSGVLIGDRSSDSEFFASIVRAFPK